MSLANIIPINFSLNEIFSPANIFILALALFWVLIASIQDFKHREVENWWNFSLIAFILAFRAFLSIETSQAMYFIWGLIGLLATFILSEAFYYARVFAGGDQKLLMALGVVLPLSLSWQINLTILITFLVLFLVSGSLYGLGYSIFLMLFNFKRFKPSFFNLIKRNKKTIYLLDIILAIALVACLITNFYFGLLFILVIFITPFLFLYAKALEESCMDKMIDVKNLTVGDWTLSKIKAGKNIIKPNWEGLSEKELKLIQKYSKGKVKVKEGIPFVPSFLIALIFLIIILKFFS